MPAPNLRQVRTFTDLIRYLEDELHWPLEGYEMEDLTFDYDPADLGLKDEDAAKVKTIRQLRPLASDQPWGIFFIEFDKKKLPVVLLRRILSHLVVKKRASANKADRAAWNAEDLLFVSAFGPEDDDGREIGFAHFHTELGDLPSLRVLGWDGADTSMKLNTVAATLRERLSWPEKGEKLDHWQQRWAGAFKHRIGHIIRTSDMLAEAMAALAKRIRDAATTIMQHETERGPLRKLHRAFQTNLIHDLTEEGFADTYALFTAALSKTDMTGGRHGTALIASNIIDMVPVTNPFLKEMLSTFLNIGGRKGGIDFDELGIQDVVELLRGSETDLPAIRDDFGNRTRGEDPVIHFYEHFLSAYNKKLKIQRGVFYTPQPVVSYIVRSVHELLQTEFGLEDGLADTTTWGEMVARHSDVGNCAKDSTSECRATLKLPPLTDEPGEKRTISPDEPFVQILDIATGTGTFIVEVIDVIHKHLQAKWKTNRAALPSYSSLIPQPSSFEAYWNDYVPQHLLPRVYGFELMMAPYAIAHMKVGLKLSETGYIFRSEERVRIYLTNTLEPWVKQLPLIGFDALAHEAAAVNEIKRHKRFTVVIGNPPYSYMSANLNATAAALIEPFRYVDGQRIREKSALSLERSLQDDFVKFFGLALSLRRGTGSAFILGLITNNSYIDSALHRGVRGELMRLLDRLYLVNLFGDSIKDREENVFDIQQGVAVFLGVKRLDENGVEAFVSNVHGTRSEKYAAMQQQSWKTTALAKIQPTAPQRYFLRLETGGEYPTFPSLAEVFQLTSTCIKTLKDGLATGFEPKEVQDKIEYFRDARTSTEDIKTQFGVEDVVQWKMEPARQAVRRLELKDFTTRYQARPFDYRWMFYHNAIVGSPRTEVMRNLLKSKNIALIGNRKIRTGECNHFWVTSRICVSEIISSADNSNCFPLYVLADEDGLNLGEDMRPNFTAPFLQRLCEALGTTKIGKNGVPADLTPEDIFHYAYAVFHSPGYRSRYAEFLKIDFPRLPLTGNLELFRALARLGGELTALHLLEFEVAWASSPSSQKEHGQDARATLQPITEFIGTSKEVTKVGYNGGTVWINASGTKGNTTAGTTGFQGVPEAVWNFHIGGYQVCEKWLKDRKGRTLTDEDIAHYHKIVIALTETIRLMAEIDEVITQHGGWPGAFQTPQA